MGGKGMHEENGKYTVTFVLYGKRKDKDINTFLTAMDDFFTKHDARNVVETSAFGNAIKAEKAVSKKWKEE